MTYTVYAVTNTNDTHVYIGATKDFRRRKASHRCSMKRGNHRNPQVRELAKQIGKDGFEFQVLETHTTQTAAHDAEQRWVDYYDHNPYWTLMNEAKFNVTTVQRPVEITYMDGTVTVYSSGLTAAAAVGVSPSHLCNWIKGRRLSYDKYGIDTIRTV